jgi:predicted amidophosphoribosyltransferase
VRIRGYGVLGALVDLVLPVDCAGCAAPGVAAPLCPACLAALDAAQPQRVRQDPEPAGAPRTYALAAYGGALRSALLAYKERHRHALAGPLGDRLAGVVTRGLLTGPRPVLLVPVPGTAAAIRRRHGDHVVRLAERAAGTLRRQGLPAAVAGALRATPKADSVELSAAERAAAAGTAFVTRPRPLPAIRAAAQRGAVVVLVDDIVTTGSTLAAAGRRLASAGITVGHAAVLAATQRRSA